MRIKTMLMGVLSLSLVVGGALAQANYNKPVVIGGNEDQLRSFIARYMNYYDSNYTNNILIAELPNLPFGLNFPEALQLNGSVERNPVASANTLPSNYEIYLEGANSVSQVRDFFDAQFNEGAGWRRIISEVSPGSGFNTNANSYGTYCWNDQGASLSFDAFQMLDSQAQVTLRIQMPADQYACNQTALPTDFFDLSRLLPPLQMPEGVSVGLTAGGAGSPDSNVTLVSLVSDLSLVDIHTAYAEQLQAQGWTKTDELLGELTSVSQWTVPPADGRNWVGVLSLVQSGTEGEIFASIAVKQAK